MNSESKPLTISIAMATYNGEKYVREQLDSLAAQSYLPCELVVTDDGSSDDTLRIIEEFSASAPFPVRIFSNETRLGYSDNFFKAAALCRGELIAYCDQDDKWMSSKLAVCVEEFKDIQVFLCVHSSLIWREGEHSARRWPDFGERIVLDVKSVDPLSIHPGFSMIFRASLLKLVDYSVRPANIRSASHHSPEPLAHDQWTWLISSMLGRVACIPDTLAFYRQHSENAFGAPKNANLMRKIRLALNVNNYERESNFLPAYATFLENITRQLPAELRQVGSVAVHKFRQRSRFTSMRALIYEGRANLIERISAFTKIMISGGYWADPSHTRLGPRAAVKDLLFGVPGLYKFRARNR